MKLLPVPDEDCECALGLAWLGLSGRAVLLGKLRSVGARRTWTATRGTLRDWGLSPRYVEEFEEARRRFDARRARAELESTDQRFIPFGSPLYPDELMDLQDPPAGLFVRGSLEALERLLMVPRVTVVGTRKASVDGIESARQFSSALGVRGVAVVSGMALGIDGNAHDAALDVGGLTVAVLGCGVDIIYPRCHRELYARITHAGLVMSELPPGSCPTKWSFPRRNRMLAALCDSVLVVEGGVTSGALQTARWGLELGRPVFAVPGSIYKESSDGCNALIYDGASPALRPQVFVEDFLRVTRMERGGREGRQCARVAGGEQLELVESLVEDAPGSCVLEALQGGPMSADALAEATGLSARDVGSALGELEVRSKVRRAGPGIFMRTP